MSAVALVGGCVDDEGQRGGFGPGIGDGAEDDDELPVQYIEDGDYGPVAEYLANNANNPIPDAGSDDGGAADDGGATSGGDDGNGGGETGGSGSCAGFTCDDGTCIDASWRCDGINDCSSNEDELGCGDSGGAGDGGGDDGGGQACDGFQCNDGACIDASWQCDQITDCTGGEDEANCGGGDSGGDGGGGDSGGDPGCSGFQCNDGTCIDGSWLCDGIIDCTGGEDESVCAAGPDAAQGLSAGAAPQKGALACIGRWTTGGGAAGTLAGEAISKGCEGAGVVVGLATGGTGFAAALVCLGADVTEVDAVVGGVAGALAGFVGGVVNCEGNALDEASSALQSLLSFGSIPTFQVKSGSGTKVKKCGVPTEVDLSGDENECSELHDEMKDYAATHPNQCNIDIGNLSNDAATIAAACEEIQRRFNNANEVAEKRLAIGQQCYDNGNEGPMGSSDYGHQVAWCSIHQAMRNCVKQAKNAKLDCDLTPTMANYDVPPGCDNLLSCG